MEDKCSIHVFFSSFFSCFFYQYNLIKSAMYFSFNKYFDSEVSLWISFLFILVWTEKLAFLRVCVHVFARVYVHVHVQRCVWIRARVCVYVRACMRACVCCVCVCAWCPCARASVCVWVQITLQKHSTGVTDRKSTRGEQRLCDEQNLLPRPETGSRVLAAHQCRLIRPVDCVPKNNTATRQLCGLWCGRCVLG